MRKFLTDPLLHFLLLGAALFGFSAWRGDAPEAGGERIVVTAEQIAQLREAAALLHGGPPSAEQLQELIEPTIREEIFYREALALGLDENDDEVRRRLVEKMQYLTQDLADPEPASEAELRAFYTASPERFRIPERVSFEQVFFSPSQRAETVERDALAALAELRTGADMSGFGDRTPLRDRYDDAPREQVGVLFGEQIAETLFTAEVGSWDGPFASDFGLHLVRLQARERSRVPPFEEIREQVLATFASVRRQQANEAEYRKLRDRYEIIVEWPDDRESDAAGGQQRNDEQLDEPEPPGEVDRLEGPE
jgi:hypothetical protein